MIIGAVDRERSETLNRECSEFSKSVMERRILLQHVDNIEIQFLPMNYLRVGYE